MIDVYIGQLREAFKVIDTINGYSLEDIRWIDDAGNEIKIDKSAVDEWKFVGMSNSCFAEHHIVRRRLNDKI